MAKQNQTGAQEGKKRPSIFKIILFIVGGIVVLGGIGNALNGDKSKSGESTTNDSNTSQEKEINYTKINLKDFIAEYDENQVTADKKYDDTYISTDGYVENISQDIVGNVYILVKPVNDDLYIGKNLQCYLSNGDEVAGLKTDGKVSIKGKVKGFGIFNVEVTECKVI